MPKAVLYLLLILVTASWGAVLPVLRYMNEVRAGLDISAWDIVWLRLVPGAAFFLVLLAARRARTGAALRRSWLPILLVGLCTTSLYNFFLVTGEEKVPASLASLVVGVNPSATFLLSVIFLGERATGRKVLGILLSLVGLVYISLAGGTAGSAPDSYHFFLTVLAPVTFSIGTVAGKRMLTGLDPLTVTASTVIAGAIPLLPFPFLRGGLIESAPDLPALFWLSVAFLVLVPLVFGYYVWYLALGYLEASQVSAFVFLVPVFGVALSSIAEPPALSALLGGAVIFAGVLLTNWNTSPPGKAAEQQPQKEA